MTDMQYQIAVVANLRELTKQLTRIADSLENIDKWLGPMMPCCNDPESHSK